MSNTFDPQNPGSVSRWLAGAREGNHEAVRQLWERYCQPLVRLARGRLYGQACDATNAEDVALDAFASLCHRISQPANGFPNLHNRTHLWKLLACFTVRRAFDLVRQEVRRRRLVTDEGVLGTEGFEGVVGKEPPPEFSAAVADLLECLPSDELRTIVIAKMEGYTNEEVSRRMGRSLSTVERKMQVIRLLWRDVH
jgi:DNA-directed RNA polymerase specialized sigma24 family protein